MISEWLYRLTLQIGHNLNNATGMGKSQESDLLLGITFCWIMVALVSFILICALISLGIGRRERHGRIEDRGGKKMLRRCLRRRMLKRMFRKLTLMMGEYNAGYVIAAICDLLNRFVEGMEYREIRTMEIVLNGWCSEKIDFENENDDKRIKERME